MLKHVSIFSFLLVLTTALAGQEVVSYPAAPGFRAAESDPQAIEIADRVMTAMGGYETWSQTRYLEWTFFGRRTLLWDKWTGWVRIDLPEEAHTYIVNIHDLEGKVWLAGEPQTQPDTLQQYLERARSIWINDSYWLVMPFKLKDSGLKLSYRGVEKSGEGALCDKLELTFENVGDTPRNKYWVYVDQASSLVVQWSFFTDANDPTPRFSTPWDGYREYGGLMLSGGRGNNALTNIAVYREVPAEVFTSRERPDF
jgi:hypothetical protein